MLCLLLYSDVIVCVLFLTNIGFMQCYSLGSLKFASFVIFSNVFVCVLRVANSGFVQCCSLDSLKLHALLCFVRFSDAFVEVALIRKFQACAAILFWLSVIATHLFNYSRFLIIQ